MSKTNPKVFISYSWAVRNRVLDFAERLFGDGIEVVIDAYDLKDGQDKYAFMEQSVMDKSIDKVLIICDKTYSEKANSRSGGVGDETAIITPEVYGKSNSERFIPIIFEHSDEGKEYRPVYLKSRIYIDLDDNNENYEHEYEKLIRDIYEEPLLIKPKLGKKPDWLDDTFIDLSAIRNSIKQIRGHKETNSANAEYILNRAIDEFIAAVKSYTFNSKADIEKELLIAIDKTKPFHAIFVEYLNAIEYSNKSLSHNVTNFIERFYNELHRNGNNMSGQKEFYFEFYDFLIMEMLISATAFCLHFEKYSELHEILSHTFFLEYYNSINDYDYSTFRKYLPEMESILKANRSPRLITAIGNLLIEREVKPILTRQTISNADIVLYQLYPIFKLKPESSYYWFPTTYIYNNNNQIIRLSRIFYKYSVNIK